MAEGRTSQDDPKRALKAQPCCPGMGWQKTALVGPTGTITWVMPRVNIESERSAMREV